MNVRVISCPRGVTCVVAGVPLNMSRSAAHRFAIALLHACVPQETEDVVSLGLNGPGPDPAASTWEAFAWR